MFINKSTALVVAATLLAAIGGLVVNGSGARIPQEKEKKELKKVPMPYTKPDSGSAMFKEYCAVCHGLEGKGDGPAVEYLKTPPPNLRNLAKAHDGKYPDDLVISTLRFGTGKREHGTADMPLWGPLFRSRDGSVSELRIHNLNSHIKTLQDK
jgi:mono/diheme cytochrome c family protein